ncbi:MAG: hypothetical protein KF770_24265 [Anaerolineae bacterium]|nr:hypothetical protein [Anaerolineae bacterium]
MSIKIYPIQTGRVKIKRSQLVQDTANPKRLRAVTYLPTHDPESIIRLGRAQMSQ